MLPYLAQADGRRFGRPVGAQVALEEASYDVVVAVAFSTDQVEPMLGLVLHLNCSDTRQGCSVVATETVDLVYSWCNSRERTIVT